MAIAPASDLLVVVRSALEGESCERCEWKFHWTGIDVFDERCNSKGVNLILQISTVSIQYIWEVLEEYCRSAVP